MDEIVISDGVLPSATVNLPQCFSLIFFDPFPLEALLHYIVPLYLIPPSTCLLLSSFVLEFLSPFPQLFDFLGIKVVENTVQRSSPCGSSFFPRYFCVLIPSVYICSLSSSLELPGRWIRVRRNPLH